MPIDRARLLSTFRTLLEIESPSGHEGDIARYVTSELARMGGNVVTDASGNVIGRFEGVGEPIMLNAHLDTVMPTVGLKIVESDGRLRSDGTTILGADDKAGVAAILEAIRSIREQGISHLPIEVVFTIAEEIGLVGAKNLDYTLVSAKRGICLDSSGPVGMIMVAGPAQISIDVTITGRAAHAGMAPEKGISAIVVASEAIAAMRLGRIDEETTANVGIIQGGSATNIVPEKVTISAEARSRDESKLRAQVESMRKSLGSAAARHGATINMKAEYAYRAFKLSESDELVRMVSQAAKSLGMNVALGATGGGSDTNIFNERGIKTVNLGIGYDDPHSSNESIAIADLVQSAELVYTVLKVK